MKRHPDPLTSIRSQLVMRRVATGIRQRDLGERLGLRQVSMSDLERGKHDDAKISTLVRWAAALGCRIEIRLVDQDTP